MTGTIRPEMRIFAAPSQPGHVPPAVASVEKVEGENFIKLKRTDSLDAKPHWIPLDWVAKVDATGVYLNKTQLEFHTQKLNYTPARL